jgi:hypothetical protein
VDVQGRVGSAAAGRRSSDGQNALAGKHLISYLG